MSVTQAIILGVLLVILEEGFIYTVPKNSPMFIGLLIGLVLGDVKQAIIIGAAIQAIYLGFIAPGGNIPADTRIAAFIAIPIALINNLEPTLAVSLAVPAGLLGVLMHSIRRTLNGTFVHMADKYAEEADIKGIKRAAYLYPGLLVALIYFVPMTLAMYYGPTVVNVILESIPEWFIHGLSVAGGILPALGFAITITVIGKKEIIPYFIIGFLLTKIATNVNTITLSIFGLFFAYLHVLFNKGDSSSEGGII